MSEDTALRGKVALVTGSSRGIGKGVALELGEQGATVYVTGRTLDPGTNRLGGSVGQTVAEIEAQGGKGVAVRCDHANDDEVKALFEQVQAEQGRVDILVNNAAAVYDELTLPGNFWEKPLKMADMIDVGIRSGYVASWYAAPMMIEQGKGLIVFTSSTGSVHYVLGPSYGAHKAGVDKMAFDMGVDFADAGVNVAATSIWMGSLTTERLLGMMEAMPELRRNLEGSLESAGYTGHVAWAMYNDSEMFARFNGRTVIGAEVGRDYGITDEGGKFPPSVRDGTGASPPQFYPYKVKM